MFGGIDDDDLDFNPAAGSKLASLFGLERSPEKGNASLTYTAPKQPKHHMNDDSVSTKKSSSGGSAPTSAASNKLSLIIVKAVTSFKLEDGNYNPQGKLGLALLGNSATRLFQLLLYKGKQQQITSVRITPHFQFTVQPHLYASFYDDRTQNWSIMFENKDDAVEFATQVAVARYRSGGAGEESIVTQELLPGSGNCFSEGETIELKLAAQPLSVDSVQVVDLKQCTIECTLSHKLVSSGWAAGLLGAAPGALRVVLIPLSISVPWFATQRNSPLLVEASISSSRRAEVENFKEVRVNESKKHSAPASGAESAVDSGTEDASVRARGASIKEALTNSPRTNKASIISRMARMGQATLPLKGAVVCNPSDSEETEEDSSNHSNTKPPLKARPTKSRTGSSVARQQSTNSPSSPTSDTGGISTTAVSVVQAPIHWNQQQTVSRSGSDGSVMHIMSPEGQLVAVNAQPLVASTVMTPTDPTPHLSMFLSEARMQNAEMRMYLNKFNDKMDQLMTKVDNLPSSTGPSPSASSGMGLEPNVLLSSIEKLVSDNKSLQTEVAEKNKRLDEQNERIFSLLNTNSKFLEQSSSLLELKQLHEQKQQSQEQEQKKQEEQSQLIQKMREEKASLGNQLTSLQNQLITVQELVQALQKSNSDLSQELDATRCRLQEKEKSIREINSNGQKCEIDGQIETLNAALEMQKSENLQLKDQIKREQSQYDSERKSADERCSNLQALHKTELTEMKDQISKQADHYKKIICNLEEKCKDFSGKLHVESKQPTANSPPSLEHLITEVKILLNTLHKGLNQQFIQGHMYDGVEIKKVISFLVKKEALQFVAKLERENSPPKDLSGEIEKGSTKCGLLESSSAISSVEDDLSKKAARKSSNASSHAASESSVGTTEAVDTTTSVHGDTVTLPDVKKDQDASYDSSWRPLPPTPPMFHEDEDSDDWLA